MTTLTITRRIFIVLYGAALLALTVLHGSPAPAATPTTTTTTTILEDSPDWVCETMGNHICGHLPATPQACAGSLGIGWSIEQGATERLDAFAACVTGESIIYFDIAGQIEGFYLNAPDRPACRVEPSDTPEGYEVIFYLDQTDADPTGFEVTCPN